MSRGFPLRSISRARSRVVARSSEAPRGRAWRRPAACRPISILRGCSGGCRARARYSSCRAISAATGSALRRGRGGRCCAGAEGGDAISGNAELRLSIAIVTFRDGLGRSIRLVVLLAGCGKTRRLEKIAEKPARNQRSVPVKSMGYRNAEGHGLLRKQHRPTFSATC